MENTKLEQIDSLIRSGKTNEALAHLLDIAKEKIDRKDAVILAGFARRLGVPVMGLKLLYPYVRSQNKNINPTNEERVEYAGNLVRLGIVNETLDILKGIDAKDFPQVLLFKSFAYNYLWRQPESTPLLEEYISHPQITEYQKVLGLVNLSENQVRNGNWIKAQGILKKTHQIIADREDFLLLKAVLFEIEARLHLFLKKYERARDLNQKALSIHGDNESFDALSARIQGIVISLFLSKKRNEESINALLQKALKLRRYELLRDVDFWKYVKTKKKSLFRKLYFSTRFDGYREWLKKITKTKEIKDKTVLIGQGQPIGKIEIHKGLFLNKKIKLNQNIHKLLKLILLDSYRPLTIYEIHAFLFQGQFFNPFSSPNKIHQLLNRTRGWLEKNKIPILIQEYDGVFSWEVRLPLLIDFSESIEKNSYEQMSLNFVEKIKEKKLRQFNRKDLEKNFKLSSRTASRVLKTLEQLGVIKKIGNARATSYVFS